MKSIFDYDNKFMQALMVIGDLIILNFLFLLCCIPVVTIGAAQAGLFNGLRVLMDKEDDSSCAAAFFRGFTNGFTKITVAFVIMLVIIDLVGWSALSILATQQVGFTVIISCIALCVCGVFQSLMSAFHSRFSCTTFQLFRNSWLLFLAHPLRSVALSLLTWSPLWLFLLTTPRVFFSLGPLFMSIFFSFVHLLGYTVMRKPFNDLIQMYNERTAAEEAVSE